jgi:hypothetical protein
MSTSQKALEKIVQENNDSNVVLHAKRELPGCKKDADEMDALMAKQVIQLLAVFSTHGHSGFSAPYAIQMFTKLASLEPLGPLTGEEDEWVDVSDGAGGSMYQNIRASNVFKDANGRAYDINGKVFQTPDGCRYTNSESRVDINFPYTPVTEYIEVED